MLKLMDGNEFSPSPQHKEVGREEEEEVMSEVRRGHARGSSSKLMLQTWR